jgi:hypothetical protein
MVAEEKVNMVGVHTDSGSDGHIAISVTLETAGVEQLTRLLAKLEGIRGVVSVSRRVEGRGSEPRKIVTSEPYRRRTYFL